MRRRLEIVLEELKNGTFICRAGRDGPEFGRADSIDDAVAVAIDWLCNEQYVGEAALSVKPFRAAPFSGPTLKHDSNEGHNLWKM